MMQVQVGQAGTPADLPVTIASLENEIAELSFKMQEPIEVQMTKEEESLYRNEWKTFCER
jgi:hypothetical protein